MGQELPIGFDGIFREGYRAGIAGTARAANPYKGNSHAASIWFNGWDAGQVPRTQCDRKPLAVRPRELALEPDLPIVRQRRRPLLPRMEQGHRSTLANHVHRTSRLGASVLINETWYKRVTEKRVGCFQRVVQIATSSRSPCINTRSGKLSRVEDYDDVRDYAA
jgi:ribosome modulation factor